MLFWQMCLVREKRVYPLKHPIHIGQQCNYFPHYSIRRVVATTSNYSESSEMCMSRCRN
jgi:hypothetical protein